MKKVIQIAGLLVFITGFWGCPNGWPTGASTDGPQNSNTKPTTGCKNDITVHYKNNCDQDLNVYFIEVLPNSAVNCTTMEDRGFLGKNETVTVIVHTGKIGFIVFAESPEGKCTSGRRKSESWINCNSSTSTEAYFNSCR